MLDALQDLHDTLTPVIRVAEPPCTSLALPADDSGSHLDGGSTKPRHIPTKCGLGQMCVQASVSTLRRICSISSKCC